MVLICKLHFFADLFQGKITVRQQLLDPRNLPAPDIAADGFPQKPDKQAGKLFLAQMAVCRYFRTSATSCPRTSPYTYITFPSALKIRGLVAGHMRAPQLDLTGEEYTALEQALTDFFIRYGLVCQL